MLKLTFATLSLFWLSPLRPAAPPGALPPLADASITIEYNATDDSATLVVEAESDEPIRRFRLVAPDGTALLDLSGPPGHALPLSGLRLESDQPGLDELFQDYPEGSYEIRAVAVGGGRFVGTAALSHELVRPPVISFPDDGLAGVPTSGLLLSWSGNTGAAAYEVALEQGETDGLRIRLPPGSTSFSVPDGFLAPATQTQLEIAAIAANGNRTITVIGFTTQ